MTGFELVAELASSLAWPAVVFLGLVLAWTKRDSISQAFERRNMDGSPRGIKRAKAGIFEIEWDEAIRSVEEKIRDDAPDNSQNRNISSSEAEFSERMSRVADLSPTAAVLESSAWIEQELRSFAEKSNIEHRRLPMRRIIQTTHSLGAIDGDTREILEGMFALRNEAAHRVGMADISKAQAHEYIQIAEKVIRELQKIN